MRFLPILFLAAAPAFAQFPNQITCAQTAYTVVCIPRLPMPCPQPPVHAPVVFATAAFDRSTQRSWLSQDTKFEGYPLRLNADASYTTDGSDATPTLELSLTDASGVTATSLAEPRSFTTALTMQRSKDLGNGKISTTKVLIRCSLE